jgi:cellulose synthase/poly-beta-1,6-N-acetylglucosamine synthase-like glycosyltransferase
MESLPRQVVERGKASELESPTVDRFLPETTRIAVLIPCFNEATAITAVVAGFKAALPAAKIYVFDNNSTDQTISVAAAAGALVR